MAIHIRPFMTSNPIQVERSAKLAEVIRKMDKHKVSHLVVSHQRRLSGVISRTDILHKIKSLLQTTGGSKWTEMEMTHLTAQDIMTSAPISIRPDDPVEYTVELFLQNQFHSLPVIEDGKVVGIVTLFDLLKAHHEMLV